MVGIVLVSFTILLATIWLLTGNSTLEPAIAILTGLTTLLWII
jgi:hypothetical protein